MSIRSLNETPKFGESGYVAFSSQQAVESLVGFHALLPLGKVPQMWQKPR